MDRNTVDAEGPMMPMRELTEAEKVEQAFVYHPPTVIQEEQYAAVRAAGKSLALTILASCPRSADRTAAVRLVREAVATANASIALRGLI